MVSWAVVEVIEEGCTDRIHNIAVRVELEPGIHHLLERTRYGVNGQVALDISLGHIASHRWM